MIADFEQRLADVLGGRLPAPFTGHARVAPEPAAGGVPAVVVRVERALPLPSGMGGEATQVVPGAAIPRRVVGLACEVEISVIPATGQGRPQQVQGMDAVVYVLDGPEFRDGSALAGGAVDPGFLIRSMRLRNVATPPEVRSSGEREDRATIRLDADGWFWPAGTPGLAGSEIEHVRLRGALAPLTLVPTRPRIVAGGAPVGLAVRVRTAVRGADGAPTRVAVRLVGAGGGPGPGGLVGAVDGVVVADVVDGAVALTYTPPATPARLSLVVALDDGAGGAGLELARFQLVVDAAP